MSVVNRPSTVVYEAVNELRGCAIPLLASPQGGEYARFQFVQIFHDRREWISRQSRRRFRRHPMMRRLLIGVGKFEQGGFAVGRTQEGDAHGQIVVGEARWDSHRSG